MLRVSRFALLNICLGLLLAGSAAAPAHAQDGVSNIRPTLVIPRVDSPPLFEDFLDMSPNGASKGKLAKVTGFVQNLPRDGDAVSQRTEAYLGYDDENLYAIFVCFDERPDLIRARMTPRESYRGDDKVDVFLDTFHDERRAYVFSANPLGIQMEGRWNEGTQRRNFDTSFDTLWYSKAKVTDRGYVVWMSIPFKSLRFPARSKQEWGIVLVRWIPRNNESSFWPRVTSRIDGRINQGATLVGLENISAGRNLQVIPFGFFRSFRGLDTRDDNFPRFVTDNAEPDVGLDAKFVLSDSFALDVAVNPDFSQVESDNPQVTVNRRFEVRFPERRPFFLENNDFFETPINLFFSRRIADPQFGLRLTGKKGPYAIGALVADDQSPGRAVLPGDPLHNTRAKFGVVRVNRDIFKESTVGFLFTDRELEGSHNRVGGADTRLKLNPNWNLTMQAVTTSTQDLDGFTEDGPAYAVELERTGRQFNYDFEYEDIGVGFKTAPGFVRRRDIRSMEHRVRYRFRPEGKYLISWGPSISTDNLWDHNGTRLDWRVSPFLSFEFIRQTSFGLWVTSERERLRPEDFDALTENRDFTQQTKAVFFRSQYIPQVNISGRYSSGKQINFVPPDGQEPVLARATRGNFEITLRPTSRLRNDNTYILSQLKSLQGEESIFTNHIIRSRWNWQFNREFSLRVILQYDTVLVNPALTRLETSKNFNADFLFTYLVNPWTALFVGYNGNMQNINLLTSPTENQIIRTPGFMHDARQFFVKFSYLLSL